MTSERHSTPQEWSQPGYAEISRLFGARTGTEFSVSRRQDAELGISRAMQRSGIGDLAQYKQRIESDAAAFDDLVVELMVGETYFFRHAEQMELLRHLVLPEIVRRKPPREPIRVWSAGCASGEEAYSLAILFDRERLLPRLDLLASDISRQSLAKARQAVYGKWSFRESDSAAVLPYLTPQGAKFAVRPAIRERVVFRHLNLALDAYPSPANGSEGLDLVLCRNVLIYFDRETVSGVARRLFASLAPGGWLVTAPADPILTGEAPFEAVMTAAGLLYRRALTAAAPQSDLETWGHETDESVASYHGRSDEPPELPKVASPDGIESSSPGDGVAAARAALDRRDYALADRLTRDLPQDVAACAVRVRALAAVDPREAERFCAHAAARHALSAELHYLHAVLLLELERNDEALNAAQRAAYLDRSLAIVHFTLGSILQRRGDGEGARRAYRNTRDLCSRRPPDEIVPLSDGECCGRLARAAEAQIASLDRMALPDQTPLPNRKPLPNRNEVRR